MKKGKILLRSLLFLPLCGLLLPVVPLCAEGPPPLPRPSTNNNGTLEKLSTFLSGTGNAGGPKESTNKVTHPPQSAHFVRTEYEEIQPPKQRSASKPISLATFTTSRQSSEEFVNEEPPLESENDPEEALVDIPHEMLDKPLSYKKLAKGNLTDEEEGNKTGGWTNKLAKPELTPLFSVGGSLFIVVAAFFLLAALLRKVSPKGNRPLPKEAFECLGRYFLTQKHQLQVLRMGSRIVLVSVMPDGVSTLAEITDPDEAVSFLGLCRRLDNNSATEMFRKSVASMSEEELSRPSQPPRTRSVVPPLPPRRQGQATSSLDLYSDPDESLATILARGRR